MRQAERHQQILEYLADKGFASTEELVGHFGVSPQTIRRDLNELAELERIKRHHGGASLLSSTVNDTYDSRKIAAREQKAQIGAAIAAEIPDGASLFIDIGTTAEAVAASLLNRHGLRVVTNNLNVAALLLKNDSFMVILAGGEVRHRDGGIIGEATQAFIRQFRMDYGILGISGIDAEDGSLLDFDYHEVRVKQAMIEHSRQAWLAADGSKFGRNAMVNLGNIAQMHALFTDREPPPTIATLLEQRNIQCHICS